MKNDAPPAPDYAAAANAESQGSQALASQQTYANRPNITTPWGSQTWNSSGGTDAQGRPITNWSTNISLSPQQQQSLDSQQAIQSGRSNAAQMLLGQATQGFQSPMNWDSLPQRSGNINAPQMSGGAGNYGADPYTQNMGFNRGGTQTNRMNAFGFGGVQGGIADSGDIQSQVGQFDASSSFNPGGDVQSNVAGSGPLQSGFSFGGDVQRQVAANPTDVRQRAQDAVYALQKPMLDQNRSATENRLANMGLARGSEAWNSEQQTLGDNEARAQLQAVQAGQNEAAQMFGQNLQAGQFANNAQQQAYGQNQGAAQFFNNAQTQGLQNNLAQGQFANSAQQQQFGQNQAMAQFGNQAANQNFTQGVQAGQFGNAAQQQMFAQNQAQGNFYNNAQQQRFGQGLQANQANNAAAGQQFNQNMAYANFQNQGGQQTFQNLMQLAQQGDQSAMQQLNAQIMAGQFNNQNRQGAIGDMTQQRGQTLNELNALLTGQQVNMPQMPSFNNASAGQAPQLLNAANMQYNAGLDQYNAGVGNSNSLMSGLGSLGSYFMFSDDRLKHSVIRVGVLSSGIPVVHYGYHGVPGGFVGVLASDVLAVNPSAVALHESGYFMVDYSRI